MSDELFCGTWLKKDTHPLLPRYKKTDSFLPVLFYSFKLIALGKRLLSGLDDDRAEGQRLSRELLKQIEANIAGKPKEAEFRLAAPPIDPSTGLPIWEPKR